MRKSYLALLGIVFIFTGITSKTNYENSTETIWHTACEDIYSETEQTLPCLNTENVQNARLDIKAKSAYLMDHSTKSVVYSYKEKEHLPIASMCKIMTLSLCFDAIKAGNLTMDEEITVSEKAASMGGSQVFLEANAKYPVRELIKSIVVCSANDSCVAMAERIAGGENIFVDKMNEKAKELGATDTLFSNCTGLPKEPQYSCAKDVADMLRYLLENEEYYQFSNVWMDKFMHPEGRFTEITNTNKLIRFYEGCDGGKTGFTNEAGFCLAATAKRDHLRMISVVIGEESSTTRFNDVKTMFDFAFANYTAVPVAQTDQPLETQIEVVGGKEKNLLALPARDVFAFCKRGDKGNHSTELRLKKLKAPIKKGDAIGEMIIFQNNIEVDRVPLVADRTIQKANWFDRLKEVAENWNKRK